MQCSVQVYNSNKGFSCCCCCVGVCDACKRAWETAADAEAEAEAKAEAEAEADFQITSLTSNERRCYLFSSELNFTIPFKMALLEPQEEGLSESNVFPIRFESEKLVNKIITFRIALAQPPSTLA